MPLTTLARGVAIAGCSLAASNGFGGASFQARRDLPRRESGLGERRRQRRRNELAASVPVVQTATVDYSAANEYVRAHYGRPSPYFEHAVRGSSVEQFHDGRVLQSRYDDDRAMLRDHGLAILSSPLIRDPEWTDLEDVQNAYLPALEGLLRDTFPSLKSYCFWNPMIRGESCGMSRGNGGDTPTANVASLAHIDTDIGAYDRLRDFLDVVENNAVRSFALDRMAADIIRGGKRFAVVNFWRNIGDTPVLSAPLGILSTRYDGEPSVFPKARPDMERSKWYVFPNATKDEVIAFYQYDRNQEQLSDLWHCAVSANGEERKVHAAAQAPPRKSFDVRALIVLDEVVPGDLDRFSSDRPRPVLTLEESGCFCDEQAERRNKIKGAKDVQSATKRREVSALEGAKDPLDVTREEDAKQKTEPTLLADVSRD